jgi:hypothetical protein
LVLGILLFVALSVAQQPPPGTYPALPSETPANFNPKTDSFEYLR